MKLWRRERETTWLLWSWLLGLWRGRRGSLTKRDELGEVGGYISSPRSSRPSFSSALSPIVRLSDSVRRLELCDVKETVYIWCRQRFQLFLIAPRGRYTSYGLLRRSFRHSFLVTIRKKKESFCYSSFTSVLPRSWWRRCGVCQTPERRNERTGKHLFSRLMGAISRTRVAAWKWREKRKEK